ncbi:MAG: hypothetical protein KR126chlam6_00185 [Candidatus Anoxychlamydiales bacterium]|nr:hypothetical protein [Candidatus Anoxychlamydiales bacterium]
MKLTPASVKDLEWTNWIIPSRENDNKKKILLKIIAIISTVGLILLVTLTVDVSKLMYAKIFGRTEPMKFPIVDKDKKEPKKAEKTEKKSEITQAEPKDEPEKAESQEDENKTTATQTPTDPIIPPLIAYVKTIVTKENIAKTTTVASKGLKLAPEILYENVSKEPNWYRKAVLVMGATIPFWIATNDLKWGLFTSATYYGSVIGYNIARARLTQFISTMKSAPSKEIQEAAENFRNNRSKLAETKA